MWEVRKEVPNTLTTSHTQYNGSSVRFHAERHRANVGVSFVAFVALFVATHEERRTWLSIRAGAGMRCW